MYQQAEVPRLGWRNPMLGTAEDTERAEVPVGL